MVTAAQLRAARALLGIDQRQLAGVSLPTIQRMEGSEGNVRGVIDTLTKVVEAFDAAGVELIGEKTSGALARDGAFGSRRSTTIAEAGFSPEISWSRNAIFGSQRSLLPHRQKRTDCNGCDDVRTCLHRTVHCRVDRSSASDFWYSMTELKRNAVRSTRHDPATW